MNEYIVRINQLENYFDDKKKKRLQLPSFVNLIAKLDDKNDIELEEKIKNTYKLLHDLSTNQTLKDKEFIKSLNDIKKVSRQKFGLVQKGIIQSEYTGMGIAIGVALGSGFLAINTAFIGIGLPIGLVIGAGLGSKKEKELEAKGLTY